MKLVPERTIEGLRFVMTSGSYPEQYNVFFGEAQVGYVRMRHGFVTAHAPNADGEEIFSSSDEDEIGDGDFETEEQRATWLTRAAQAIRRRMRLDLLAGGG